MSRLVLAASALLELREALLVSDTERCAILFGRAIVDGSRLLRVVVREVNLPSPDDYELQSPIAARLRPSYVSELAQRARKTGESIIFAHSHPFSLNDFSETDDAGESALNEFLQQRTPGVIHAALLVTPEVTRARVLGTKQSLNVIGIGETLQFGDAPASDGTDEKYDRQIRMFGSHGQERLSNLRVGIVGLGGTGSVVLEQLAHLGIRDFCLIDPDVAESTNLNRLIGASDEDVGRYKTAVATALIQRIRRNATVEAINDSVLLARVSKRLLDVDFLFCCTDSQGSRSVLNQLAYQYLIPSIDLGVSIVVEKGKISHLAGRTNMLAPGLGCFVCGNLLNPEAVRVDLLTDFERNLDPYVVGAREPAPAVISLNATMASMAITMFMGAALGIPASARFINYDGISGACRPAQISQHPKCVVCSSKGAFARADEWPMPGRLG